MERHSYLFKRNLLLTSCLSILTVLFQNHKIVTGQPVLSISGDANCNETATLVCAQPGFSSGTGRLWKKNSIRINENGLVVAGYERYTEESTANDFSLKISGAMPGDIAEYLCEYNFQTSNTEQLSFECKPTTSGVKCRRNNDDKLECDISDVYPNTTTVDSVILTPQGEGAAETISGTLGPPVDSSGDYFNFIWTSTDVIPDGSYGCQFTITTISATNITISFTFEITTPTPEPPCDLEICYIGVFVAIPCAIAIVVVYFFVMSCKIPEVLNKVFGLKILLPSCIAGLVCVVLVVAICIPVEPDCDKGLGVGLPVVIVILLNPCASAGVVVIHIIFFNEQPVTNSTTDGSKEQPLTNSTTDGSKVGNKNTSAVTYSNY